MSIKVNQRNAIHTDLQDYCHHRDVGDFMEATEWTNGEGWDIIVSTQRGDKYISLTHGEVRALLVLTNYAEASE